MISSKHTGFTILNLSIFFAFVNNNISVKRNTWISIYKKKKVRKNPESLVEKLNATRKPLSHLEKKYKNASSFGVNAQDISRKSF